ncbi:MAG: hypothetical protein KME64_03660 [Scytonematopsis contorta HA4267-MV1]|nr:hypothetical protein [Scytonematopsis contorta HA4267-MV1]
MGLRLRGEQLAAGIRFIRLIRENTYDLVIGNPPYQGTSKMADAGEFAAFGTSMKKVAIELFRINGGKQGYYIANILDNKYYYCGTKWEDVKVMLKQLGIGRDDPM